MTTCYHPEHRIAFIHIPKCVGTAIAGSYEKATDTWSGCWLNEQLPGWTRENLPAGHQPVKSLPLWTDESRDMDWWNLVIVPIRNPFAQQVSQYLFWRHRGILQGKHPQVKVHADDEFAIETTFENFVADPRSNGPNAHCGDRWLDAGGVYRWWCSDRQNRVPSNVAVIRVEDLPGCLEDLLKPFGVKKFTPIPRRNANPHKIEWQQWYTPQSAKVVAQKFAWSLALYYPELLAWQKKICDSNSMAVA